MTYENALKYISNTLKFGSKPGLERIGKLLDLMGKPQKSLKFVHIAGTNGKGSTANAVAAACAHSGIKTGLYTSPYVNDFCERIQINGEKIPHNELAAETERIMPYVEKASESCGQVTEFELITALAFDYFKRQNCGLVVLEVGLGGRFDATNIIDKPLVSVITSISYDHTAILGNTLAKIAFEKCGIIKNGGITVTSPSQNPEALEVIMRTCAERANTLIMPSLSSVKILSEDILGTSIDYGGMNLHIPLAGRHQIENFTTAVETIRALRQQGINIKDEEITEGMSKLHFAARTEILCKNPLVLLDGAHNPSGAAALADTLKRYLKQKPVLIMGMLADKDYETSIAALAPIAKDLIAVKPDSPRALEPEKTALTAKKYCKNVSYCYDYSEAFCRALNLAGDAPIVICGSLYLAGGMRSIVLKHFDK
jgi:dihydrofolate synthase/folylpolyglutamate synthase